MTKKSHNVVHSVNSSIPKEDNPDKLTSIRQLLFGEEIARLDATIADHYKLFSEKFISLETLIKTSNDKIEKNIQSAMSELNQSISVNNNKHLQQEDKLEQKLIDFSSRFKEFKTHTEHDLSEAHSELETSATKIYKSLEKEVRLLSKKIEQTSQELSANKTDRKTLATLLETMAVNLIQGQKQE